MPARYRHITAADFEHGLQVAGLTADEFGRLYGVRKRRVQRWLDGAQEIPHSVTVMLGLFEDSLVAAKAKTITDMLILEEEGAADAEE